jgi:hypothetical protein
MEAAPISTRPARRALLARLAALVVAVGLGLVLQNVLTARLASIDALAKTDLLAARAQLARVFEIAGVCVFGLTGAIGVMVISSSRRSLALEQFPPPGRWSWGSRRAVLTGKRARTFAQVGIGLGVTLVLASAAGGGLLWYMAAVLRACRAGVRSV